MIKIKCNKTQYNKLITALSGAALDNKGRCFLGKDHLTCPADMSSSLSCEECLKKNIKRVDKMN